jgi:Big-like domain-containing protein
MTLRHRRAAAGLLLVLAACHGEPLTPTEQVKTLELSPATLSLQRSVNPTATLVATPRDAKGGVVTGAEISWQSANPAIATVSSAGVVTAAAAGATTITATSGHASAGAAVTVTEPPVASVSVTLGLATIGIGETTLALAALKDAVGGALGGRSIAWSSSAPEVAAIASSGVVTALGAGVTSLTARSEDISGSAELHVVSTPPNLVLENVYLTQAVQRFGGGIPLVAGGNPVLANVFVTLDRPFRAGLPAPRVRLDVFQGGALVLRDEGPISEPLGAVLDATRPTYRVVLPSSIVAPGLRLLATVNPDSSPPEATLADNGWPRSAVPAALAVQQVPPLQLHFVPITLGPSTGLVTPSNLTEYLYATHQLHPVSTIDATIGEPLSSSVNLAGGSAEAWLTILQQLDLRRVMEGSDRYYVGSVRPPPGITFVQFGGFAYIPVNLQSTGSATRTAVVVGVGWFNRARQTTELVAHELAHTMGRMHAPCGGAAGPDPNFPYPTGAIGVYGHDLYTYSLSNSGFPVEYAPSASDVMSYCTPVWISDYNYEGLLNARAQPATLLAGPPPRQRCTCLIVWGSIERDSLRLEPSFVMETYAALPGQTGRYTLEGQAGDGTRLFALSFEPTRIDHAPDVRHFTFAIPLSATVLAALDRIRVSGAGGATLRSKALPAVLPSTGALGDVSVERTSQGLVVRWDPLRFPLLVVRDPATGDVLGIGKAGTLALRTDRSELDAILSNGVASSAVRLRPLR